MKKVIIRRNSIKESLFNSDEYNELLTPIIVNLWKAFDELERTSSFYLKKSGQGGLVSAVKKQYLTPIDDAIRHFEEYLDKK
jgi:hypothetical protein